MADIKYDAVALTSADVIEFDCRNILSELCDNFVQTHAGFMYGCFRKYGFTKEWLHDPVNIKRVKIARYEKPGTIYYIDRCSVDNMDIFSIDIGMTEDMSGFEFKMIPHQCPAEVKTIFGFPIEEDSNEPD